MNTSLINKIICNLQKKSKMYYVDILKNEPDDVLVEMLEKIQEGHTPIFYHFDDGHDSFEAFYFPTLSI